MTLLRREVWRKRYMLRMMAPRSTTTPPTTPPTLAIAPIGFDLVVDEDDEGLPTSESPTERHESTHHLWLETDMCNQPLLLIFFTSEASNCTPFQVVAEEVNVRLQSWEELFVTDDLWLPRTEFVYLG